MPSARRVGAEQGPAAPAAPIAGPVNGGAARRTPEWAAPPRWVARDDQQPAAPREQLTAFDDRGDDDHQAGDADHPRPWQAPAAAAPAGASADAGERSRTGRGFAYDLIADDPAFANDPEAVPFDDDLTDGAFLAGQASTYAPPPSSPSPAPYAPPPSYAPPSSPVGRAEAPPMPPADTAWPDDHAPTPRRQAAGPSARAAAGRTGTPRDLPAPDYLPPARQMASPAPRHVSPFEGERDWEKPRRFEAYPTLRTRVSLGMPGMPRVGRLPPVAIGFIALLLAAGFLFMLPGLLPGPDGGGSQASRSPGGSARPTITAAPTPTPAPTPVVYIVKSGDTFSGIAKAHGLTIEDLKAANPQITNINRLSIGQRINIPDETAGESTPDPSEGLEASDLPTEEP